MACSLYAPVHLVALHQLKMYYRRVTPSEIHENYSLLRTSVDRSFEWRKFSFSVKHFYQNSYVEKSNFISIFIHYIGSFNFINNDNNDYVLLRMLRYIKKIGTTRWRVSESFTWRKDHEFLLLHLTYVCT